MQIVHLPSNFEGGLRRAVLDYSAAPAGCYESLLWRCDVQNGAKNSQETVFPQTFKQFNLSVELLKRAWQGPVTADIVHHHGCWSLTSMAAFFLHKRHGLPLVYSPHGAFIPASLKRHRTIKELYLGVWEGRVLKEVDCFHAVSKAEVEALRVLSGNLPIALIPNGINLQQTPLMGRRSNFWDKWGIPEDSFKIFFLSRLVADKGADLLFEAMRQVRQQVPHAHCIVAGDGPADYLAKLRQQLRLAKLVDAVTFVGTLTGEEKFSAYRNADIFVLPSRNEAQGIVVLEALSQNLPVLVSKETPYDGVMRAGCGWWRENSPEVLATSLVEIAGIDLESLRSIGAQGRGFLRQHYALSRTHEAFQHLYAWLLAGKPEDKKPDTVQCPR